MMKLLQKGIIFLWALCFLTVGGCGLSAEEMQQREMEHLTGVPFPSPMPPVLVKDRNTTGKPPNHFYRLRIYERQDAWEWLEEPDCSTHGLTRGFFGQIPVTIEPVAEHLHPEQDLCYRVTVQTRSTRAVFIQDNKLVYYFRMHLPDPGKEESNGLDTHKS